MFLNLFYIYKLKKCLYKPEAALFLVFSVSQYTSPRYIEEILHMLIFIADFHTALTNSLETPHNQTTKQKAH